VCLFGTQEQEEDNFYRRRFGKLTISLGERYNGGNVAYGAKPEENVENWRNSGGVFSRNVVRRPYSRYSREREQLSPRRFRPKTINGRRCGDDAAKVSFCSYRYPSDGYSAVLCYLMPTGWHF